VRVAVHGTADPQFQRDDLNGTCDNIYSVGIMRYVPLGEFEQIVLLAILRLGQSAYGVTIRREIAVCTGRQPAPGALYTTLDRMEQKGLVESWFGDPTPQRGGRAKRYFMVTTKGHVAVAAAQRSYQKLLRGLRLPGGAHA
jgi:PadR family transcriptional regulator, regulatory protein PadR